MKDLDKALAEIVAIRTQLSRGATFHGYGPATLAATGLLALGAAAAQARFFPDPDARPVAFLAQWVGVALAASALIGWEAVTRSRRLHSGLANALIADAVDHFLPAGAAGVCLGLVILRCAPDSLWMLPGLWQMLVGLGLFAACRSLPRGTALGAGWYVLAGMAVLAMASRGHTLSPWFMGVPFAFGQTLIAAMLHRASRDGDADD